MKAHWTRRGFLSGSGMLLTSSLMQGAQRTGEQGSSASEPSAGPPNQVEALALASIIDDLVAANRIAADQGVMDGYGHVSVRDPNDPNRYLMSRWMAAEDVTADDIFEFDLDSKPLDAKGQKMQSERFIHGGIYKVRPDVNAVIHMHAPSVVLLGVSGEPARAIYHMAGFIGEEGLPLFDIRSVAGMTNMLVGNLKYGAALAEALGGRPAILMRGHGATIVGPNLSYAVGRSVYLKINSEMQVQVLGKKIEYLSPDEARLADSQGGYRKDWEAWKQKLMHLS